MSLMRLDENRNSNQTINRSVPDPDFLISKYAPTTTEKYLSAKKSWLIGDFKLDVQKVAQNVFSANSKKPKSQWLAIKNYALEREYIPLAMYITFYQAKGGKAQINKIRGKALEQGVLLHVIPLTTIKK